MNIERPTTEKGPSANQIPVAPGENLYAYAQRLIDAANGGKGAVRGEFNNVAFEVTPGSDENAVMQVYEENLKTHLEAWEASPEVKAMKAQLAKERKAKEAKSGELLAGLDTLDFNDLERVLDWIAAFQEVSDVAYDNDKVLHLFQQHGFDPDVNVGADFDEKDPQNYAKYIVGQALQGVRDGGPIHQVAHGFVSKWKRAFGREAA